jgi:transcriptional regulator with XRE-family HTH domain
MGTTQSSIARIESGGSLLTLDVLARLAHATGTLLPPCGPRHYRRRPRRSRQTRAAGTFIMTLAHS